MYTRLYLIDLIPKKKRCKYVLRQTIELVREPEIPKNERAYLARIESIINSTDAKEFKFNAYLHGVALRGRAI